MQYGFYKLVIRIQLGNFPVIFHKSFLSIEWIYVLRKRKIYLKCMIQFVKSFLDLRKNINCVLLVFVLLVVTVIKTVREGLGQMVKVVMRLGELHCYSWKKVLLRRYYRFLLSMLVMSSTLLSQWQCGEWACVRAWISACLHQSKFGHELWF